MDFVVFWVSVYWDFQ